MNRRLFIRNSAIASGGAALGMVTMAPSCNPPKVSTYISIFTGALGEIKIILPGQVAIINKIITVAHDFDAANLAGKFADAKTLLLNLVGLFDQFTADLGVSVPLPVKTALLIASVAIRAIAVLINARVQAEPAAAERAAAPGEMNKLKQLADEKAIDAALKAIKH